MTKPIEPSFPAIFTQNARDLRPFDRDMIQVLGSWAMNLVAILDSGISFSDNVDVASVTFTSSGTPDAENTVAHTLGKIPTGYIVTSLNKAASVYKGTTAWSATNIYLKSNVASTEVKILVF